MLPLRRIFLLLLAVVSLAPLAPAQNDFTRRADALVEAYAQAGKFNGTVLVADGDSVLYERAIGYADMSWRVPNTLDTRFKIASITKQFTAVLIHQLAEEGLLDLDATIRATLPSYPAAQGDRVTLRHLLTHTSGIPNFTRLPGWRDVMRDPVTPQDFLSEFSTLPLGFEPGTEYTYSGSNYIILGVIVEHVTGQHFMQAMQERLLDPLELRDTGYDNGSYAVDRMARGYTRIPGGFMQEEYLSPSFPYAAGMLYSTAGDLRRWMRALHRGEVFHNPETLAKMLTPGRGEAYGYAHGIITAWGDFGPDTLYVVHHGGGVGGFHSEDRYVQGRDWTIVVLDNARGDVGALSSDIMRLLLNRQVEYPTPSIATVLRGVIDEHGIEAAEARYRSISESEPEAYKRDETELNELGYVYLAARERETAIRIFALNAEAFPESWNVYDSLGEGLAAAGRTPEAIAAYERSIELNPENAAGQEILNRLRRE